MPPVSTLFLVSLPTILLALVWQLGLPDFENLGQAVINHPTVQNIFSQFTVTNHCYESILTLTNSTKVDCFKIEDGRFKHVYLDETPADMRKLERPRSGHVIPGLWDGHGHLIQYGESLESVDLFGAASMKEVQKRLVKYKAEHPETGTSEQWLRGVGWDQANYGGKWPVASDLEIGDAFEDLYVMLDRVDVHCIWVSNKVLSLLPADIGEIPGGEIPATGIFCDNAMDVVLEKYPKPGPEAKTKFIKNAMRELNKFGIVGMHDAGVTPSELKLYRKLAKDDDWTVRVNAMVECAERNTFCPKDVSKFSDAVGKIRIRSVKLFADGALGSWGSAMIKPYSDKPSSSGSLLVDSTKLTQLTHNWAKAGYQVNIHAIGDLANRLAIDAFEGALKSLCPSEWELEDLKECQQKHYRFRIEHAQIIHPNDQLRMLDLGIIPSIQPTHATSDMSYAESRLGKHRTSTAAYRMRSILPLNPVLGSDFPVEPASIFEGIYAAMTRRSPKTGRDPSGGTKGWYPEETLSLEQALKGFTVNPALGSFLERKAGVIQMGAYADWVVLDEPLESLDVESLRTATIRETWVGGKLVYRRPIPEKGS